MPSGGKRPGAGRPPGSATRRTRDIADRAAAEGYRAIFDGWFQGRPDFAMEGDPYLERHGRTPEGAPVVTVCVRVRPIVVEGDFNMAVVPLDGAVATVR